MGGVVCVPVFVVHGGAVYIGVLNVYSIHRYRPTWLISPLVIQVMSLKTNGLYNNNLVINWLFKPPKTNLGIDDGNNSYSRLSAPVGVMTSSKYMNI